MKKLNYAYTSAKIFIISTIIELRLLAERRLEGEYKACLTKQIQELKKQINIETQIKIKFMKDLIIEVVEGQKESTTGLSVVMHLDEEKLNTLKTKIYKINNINCLEQFLHEFSRKKIIYLFFKQEL